MLKALEKALENAPTELSVAGVDEGKEFLDPPKLLVEVGSYLLYVNLEKY